MSYLQGALQIQGHGPFLWLPDLEDPFGGMPTDPGKASTREGTNGMDKVGHGFPVHTASWLTCLVGSLLRSVLHIV